MCFKPLKCKKERAVVVVLVLVAAAAAAAAVPGRCVGSSIEDAGGAAYDIQQRRFSSCALPRY